MLKRADRSEAGAVAIMVAVSMTMIMVAVALTLDFGIVRLDRQTNKAAADAAVLEGIRAVEGNDGSAKPWKGVCQALMYLQANDNGKMDDLSGTWKTGAGVDVVGDPCLTTHVLHDANCIPGTPSSWAWYTATASDGRMVIDIKSGYELSDGGFPEEAVVSGDDGSTEEDGCDQLAVIIQESRSPGLGSLVVDGDIVSRIRSVARTTPGDDGDAAVALLMLEQHDCLVINIEGDSGARVLVQGAGDRPGMIHSDSLGDGDLCTGSDKIIDGDFSEPPRIWAEDAVTGDTPLAPGVIGVRALTAHPDAEPDNSHDSSPDYVYAEGQPDGAPIGRDLITRAPVDARYRQPVRDAITQAAGRWNMTAAEAALAGYHVHIDCAPPATTIAATLVFVNCPAGIAFSKAFVFSGANATVVFNGPVTVDGNTASLTFTDARNVYIKGSEAMGIGVTKAFRVNTGGVGDCDDRVATTSTIRSKLVVGDGPFVAQGQAAVQMCQTAVVMADDDGTCPVPSTDGLAPYDNTCTGYIDIRGSGGLDWSAPNETGPGPTATDFAELEDLALWTETSGDSSTGVISKLEGGGAVSMSGVFFLPNAAPFRIAGNGTHDINRNAQLIARRLEVAGNGFLSMLPDPDDVVTVPYWGDSVLVR